MGTYWNQVAGPFDVTSEEIVHGMIVGSVFVRSGGILDLHGMITGDLSIDPGGVAIVRGKVDGLLANEGEVIVYGMVERIVTAPGGKTEVRPNALVRT